MARLLYISPLRVEGRSFTEVDATSLLPGNEMTAIGFRRGPEHVEYHYYETLVLPDLVRSIIAAEEQGYDAAVIGCFYDFGLEEGREVSRRMVVTAPCESSVLLAASLGHRFSIIVGRQKWIPQMHGTIRRYGLESRLASFQTLGFGVPDYHKDENETARRFLAAGRTAIEEDGAEVLILGCTASAGFYRYLQDELGVPVIDSALAAVKRAEHLVDLRDRFGWGTSKIGGYEAPPAAEVEAFGLDSAYDPRDITEVWQPYPVLTRVEA
jgi:allantoin racemase